MQELIKRIAPEFVRGGVRFLRSLLRGQSIDEATLKSLQFWPEDANDIPRLNLALPTLSAKSAFGGVYTAIDLLLDLAIRLNRETPFDVRIIVDDTPRKDDDVLEQFRASVSEIGRPVSILSCQSRSATVATRKNDIFIAFNWWTNINIMPVLNEQATHFGIPRKPRFYVIQDYEPGFYPFSSAHLYALHAYNALDDLYGIFNSSLLYDYFRAQGNSAKKAFVFEPKLPARMRPFQRQLGAVVKSRTIIVYGRPEIDRNCFTILMAGLRQFRQKYPSYDAWEFISVGTGHKPLHIGGGRHLKSAGKLPIEDYAAAFAEHRRGRVANGISSPELPTTGNGKFRCADDHEPLRKQRFIGNAWEYYLVVRHHA